MNETDKLLSLQQARVKEKSSFSEFVLNMREWVAYIFSKWKLLALSLIILIILALLIFFLTPKKYIAESNLVLENANSSTPSLLSQLGFGGSDATGLFTSADNMLWLYSTDEMIRRSLLTEISMGNKQTLLVTEFIKQSKNIQNYLKDNPDLKQVKFSADNADNLDTKENKLITRCVKIIKEDYLSTTIVNNTNNIINIKVICEDELFAYNFTKVLIKTVNTFYINTKTQKIAESIRKLEEKADSLGARLNSSIYQTAASSDAHPYANPNLQILQSPTQQKGTQVQVATALYMQIMQSLESSRINLAQETPIIQIVDAPALPLPIAKTSIIIIGAIVVILGMGFEICFLILRKRYMEIIATQ